MIIDVAPGQVEGKKGLVKTIDKASEKLALNILQVTMYSFPIQSCLREAVSNSLDAVKEKNIAKSILQGKSKVEDYYIDRIGEEFEASKFDKSYYDLNWLSDNDRVVVTYKENNGLGFCDEVTIEDNGCGISPNRFVKVVGLLYSTKRNNLKTIGGLKLPSPVRK